MSETNHIGQRQVIYVRLLNEGTDVWRPVGAIQKSADTFLLCAKRSQLNLDEEWEFPDNTLVRCELRSLSSGNHSSACLFAVAAVKP